MKTYFLKKVNSFHSQKGMKGASKMAWQVKALVVVKPDHSSLIPRIHTSEGKSDFYKLS